MKRLSLALMSAMLAAAAMAQDLTKVRVWPIASWYRRRGRPASRR
jgi:hypothetical protein